jgi:ferrous iron transport protein A
MNMTEVSADIRGIKNANADIRGGTALSLARIGEPNVIQRVSGKEDACRFLGNLGFIEGQKVIVIKESNGDVIVEVLGSRVAICKSQARRITVRPTEAL